MDDIKLKKEVVEKIKSSTNILITVSNDPSVDALSAALGLTLALTKMDKYATAIYSGTTPPAINFLEPEKTFENNTDILRDFIIALNREKADHLKFKPDGDYVKIFITPYKTTIKPEDLEFSQGDYNVELVIALGVDNQDHLDGALDSHGQILHDAAIITMTVGEMTSALGGIDWHDAQSSSLSEMAVGLVEALKADSKSALIDGPIATSFLTGIVAQTDRFSNSYTTSKVMTVAANLMAAGADQQLVAFKLQESHEISQNVSVEVKDETSSTEPAAEPENAYAISHDDAPAEGGEQPSESAEVADSDSNSAPEEPAADNKPGDDATEAPSEPAEEPQQASDAQSEPVLTNAYAAEPEEPSHAYIAGPSPLSAYAPDPNEAVPAETANAPAGFPGTPEVAPGSVTVNNGASVTETILSHEEPTIGDLPAADPAPKTPTTGPADLGLPMPPPLPDFAAAGFAQPLVPVLPVPASAQPERLGDILAPEPTETQAPAIAPAPDQALNPTPDSTPQAPVAPIPGQFQIPNQQ